MVKNELEVSNSAALSRLPLTRLIIAHRPETIAGARRVVVVADGQVQELLRDADSIGAPQPRAA